MLVTPDIGALIVSFVVCGIGLMAGLFMLRSVVPRRDPISLFAGSGGISPRPASRTAIPSPVNNVAIDAGKTVIERHGRDRAVQVVSSEPPHKVSSYKASNSSGGLAFATAIAISLILGGRVSGGLGFLALVVPCAWLVALALYWTRERQTASLARYDLPVAGGVVLVMAMAGVGLVMMHFEFLRVFLGLTMGAGAAIALFLNQHRQRQSSSSSFIQLHAESGSFSRTMRIE
jgi:hypothetical protein